MIVKELFARLGFKVDEQSTKKAEDTLSKVKGVATTVAGVLAAAAVTKGFSDLAFAVAGAGDEIAKTSKRLGFASDSLQELRHVANLAGVDAGAFTNSLGLLQKNARDASMGSKSMSDAFGQLGVNVKNSDGSLKSAEVLLGEVADGMAKTENATMRTGIAQTLLGRSGRMMIPLLEQGSEAIGEQRKEARELGFVYSKELLGQSEGLVDAQARMSGAFQGVKMAVAGFLIPALTGLLNWLAPVIGRFSRWLKESLLVRAIIKSLGVALGILALLLLGKLVAAFAVLATTTIAATGAIGAFNAALLVTKLRALLLGGAFIFLLGLIFLLADEIMVALEGGDTLGKRISNWLGEIVDMFLEFKTDNPFIKYLQKVLEYWILIKNTAFAAMMAMSGDFSGFKVVAEDAMKFLGFGGKATAPVANRSPSAPAGGGTLNKSVNVGEIVVNTSPGQSEVEVAENVRAQMARVLDDRDAEDEQILIPAQAGVVR
jgi:TP901 family phage tail tape measure protein